MNFRTIGRTVAIASLALLLAACGSRVKLDESATAPVENRSTGQTATASDNRAVAQVDTTQREVNPLNNPGGQLAQRTVFFDFDSYTVRPADRALIEAHARYLAANPTVSIILEGHTDERGTSEYNLALGQRRSEAVRSIMSVLGVKENQIETVSFGKEKPRAQGSTEEAWAQNRRVEIVYR
jgi:peptidoglycan-associated lipoprotein